MRINSPHDFWAWFQRLHIYYLQIHQLPQHEMLFWVKEIRDHLNLYHMGDWQVDFEWHADGSPADMIFSARNQAYLFPAIDRLIELAPEIPGWKFHAGYPPRCPGHNIIQRFGDTGIEPDELWFDPGGINKVGGEKRFLNIYAELYNPAIARQKKVIKAILINLLGERPWVMDIAGFQVKWLFTATQEEKNRIVRLEQLPAAMEQLKNPWWGPNNNDSIVPYKKVG